MIRPGSLERSFRAAIGIAGDFVVAWWSLAPYGPAPPRTRRRTSAAHNMPNVAAMNSS